MGRFVFWMFVLGAMADPCSAQEGNVVHDADISSVRIVNTDRRPTTVVKPIYPEAAKKAGVQGLVVLDIVIGRTGEVGMARAISGPKKLRSAAAEAVKQWKWEPFLLNEKPIPVRTKVVVNFCLGCANSPEHE
jgi:TonB family protein